MGKAIKRVGVGLTTGGISELGGGGTDGLKNLLLGKKQGDTPADAIAAQIRNAQSQGIASSQKGLGELNAALDKSGGDIVAAGIREGVSNEKKGILSAAQDARRRAQQSIAQRGLQNSSLGLSSDRSITQQAGEGLASAQAKLSSIPGAVREQQLRDAQLRQQAGQGIFGGLGGTSGIRFQAEKGGRSGGALGFASSLAPLAGTIAGGAFGGPMGAQAGGQAGGAISNAFGTAQKPQQSSYFSGPNPYA